MVYPLSKKFVAVVEKRKNSRGKQVEDINKTQPDPTVRQESWRQR